MGRSKDLATGETRFVNTSGDSMTGALSVSGGANSAHLTLSGSANRGLKISTSNPDGQNDGTVILNAQDTEASGVYAKMAFQTAGTERMKIDNAGRVTKPSQPCFLVNGNQGGWQTVSQGNTSTVSFHQEQFDQGNNFNNSTMRFVAPVAGKYLLHFSAYVRLESYDDDSNHAYTRIQKNGSNYAETFYIYGYFNKGDADQQTTITVIMDMAANDYAMCALSAASGSASYYQPGCQFMGYLVA